MTEHLITQKQLQDTRQYINVLSCTDAGRGIQCSGFRVQGFDARTHTPSCGGDYLPRVGGAHGRELAELRDPRGLGPEVEGAPGFRVWG